MGCGSSQSPAVTVYQPDGNDTGLGTRDNAVINKPNNTSYSRNAVGLQEMSVDFRRHFMDARPQVRPKGSPDQLYVDQDFPLHLPAVADAEWKRPKEFRNNPKLFAGKTQRSLVQQGSVGNCWFMSVVANVADDQMLVEQLIPDTAYYIENPAKYDGIFQARFFRFGKWRDVYTDDYLPVNSGNDLLGASSKIHDEFWVSLLEKAFAKSHGSYNAIQSGSTRNAYLELSSGIGEEVDLKDIAAKDIFNRIKNAISSGSQVTCSVPENDADTKGLVKGHAYSLVGAEKVNQTEVLRIRNPWGKIDWSGPWSEGSAEWKKIPEGSTQLPKKENGEFFINLSDFMKYFYEVTFCSLTPDFDMDGIPDKLDHVLHIYGEWFDDTASGFQNTLKNPKFLIDVPKPGKSGESTVPIFIQLIQRSINRKSKDLGCKCYAYKVMEDRTISVGRYVIYEANPEKLHLFKYGLQSCYRFQLSPGRHIIIPSTQTENEMRAFLLRIYSSVPLQVLQEIPQEVRLLSCNIERSLKVKGDTLQLGFEKTLFGRFLRGVNAGGQVSHRDTHHLNPQYLISVPDAEKAVPLIIHVLQQDVQPKFPLGVHIYHVSAGLTAPLDYSYILKNHNTSPTNLDGKTYVFVNDLDVCTKYLLPTGQYMVLVHLDKPKTEKVFSILFQSTMKINITGYQTGLDNTK